MPYVFIMPNTKYPNGNWWARITLGDRTWEIDTLTRKLRHARRFAEKVEAEAAELYLGQMRTVAWAIDAYIDCHAPSGTKLQHLLALRHWFGQTALRSIGQPEIDRAARELYPGLAASTWCSRVYRPMIAILRRNGLVAPIRQPTSRRAVPVVLTRNQAEALLSRCTDSDYRAFLTLLFFSGARSREVLRLTWDRVDLAKQRVLLNLSYREIDQWRPLHRRVSEALASLPRRQARIFPWPIKRGPDRAMRRLRRETGIYFNHRTPRYSFASWLAQEGVRTRDIMDACGWASLRMAVRAVGDEGERERSSIDLL